MPTIALDVISDVICPWCYIGKRRLEAALAQRPEIEVDIRWRAFALNPDMPREGMDRQEYIERKFGGADAAQATYARIAEAGRGEGISFAFDRIGRTPNTTDSHRLIRWAAAGGMQNAVVEKLFAGYFTEGLDIGDPSVLAEIAGSAGMDGALAADLLAGDQDVDLVEQEIQLAREIGVTGVPCFVFANKFGIMGAQSPEILADALDRAQSEIVEATAARS